MKQFRNINRFAVILFFAVTPFALAEEAELNNEAELITPIQAIMPISLRNTNIENPQATAKIQINAKGEVEGLVVIEASHVDLVSRAENLIKKALFESPSQGTGESVRFLLVLPFQYPSELGMRSISPVDDTEIMIDGVKFNDKSVALYKPGELDQIPQLLDKGQVYIAENDAGEPISGRAVVEFYINHLGEVRLPRIVNSTDDEVSIAAIQSIIDMKFTPPLHKERPGVTLLRMPFTNN